MEGREMVVIDGQTYVEPEGNTNADWLKLALHDARAMSDEATASPGACPEREGDDERCTGS